MSVKEISLSRLGEMARNFTIDNDHARVVGHREVLLCVLSVSGRSVTGPDQGTVPVFSCADFATCSGPGACGAPAVLGYRAPSRETQCCDCGCAAVLTLCPQVTPQLTH